MPQARLLVPFLNLGHVLVHLFMLIFPTALLVLAPAWHMSYGQLVGLALGGFIAYGAGSLPSGWLGDHWDRRLMMAIFFLGTGLASLLTGLARSPFEIGAGLTILGFFASIYHPVGVALLVEDASRLGRRLGVNGLCGNLGIASAALVTGALAEVFGWRAAFILPAVVSLAAGIAFLVLVPQLPRARAGKHREGGGIPGRILMRVLAILVLATVCDSLVFNAVTISMPKLFAERLSFITGSTLGVGALVSGVYAFAALAQLWVGRLIDRHALRSIFIPIAALQIPLLALAGFARGHLVLPATAALMFMIFGLLPVLDAVVARYADERWRARAFAVGYVVSFGVSPAAVPLIAVMHSTAGGFASLFYLLAVVSLGTFAAALAFPRAGAGEKLLAEPASA